MGTSTDPFFSRITPKPMPIVNDTWKNTSLCMVWILPSSRDLRKKPRWRGSARISSPFFNGTKFSTAQPIGHFNIRPLLEPIFSALSCLWNVWVLTMEGSHRSVSCVIFSVDLEWMSTRRLGNRCASVSCVRVCHKAGYHHSGSWPVPSGLVLDSNYPSRIEESLLVGRERLLWAYICSLWEK